MLWYVGEFIAAILPRILNANEHGNCRVLSGRRDLELGTDLELTTLEGMP
jgi:hypothetical protein